jgi:peptidoglycan hydrolase-like protein with peptidoglycan-binding domain
MTIAKNAASKLFVAMVAAAMVFTLATPAKAATAEELQAQIDALMAQISGLGGTTATASTAACTFTRPLTIGSEGADVKCLQDAMTPTYFSNAGGSTGYFGPVTQAAVAKWQAANGVSPAAGYFGPVSQAKFASMAPTTPTGDDDDDDTTATDDDDDDDTSGPLSGEASLDNVEVSDGDDSDDVEEGSEDAQVAEITVEFADGDAMVTRLDIALDATTDGNDDVQPWDVFDEVSLWVDGDEVARMDASDEDEYLDEDDGSLRFSGLDIVAREDEEVVIVVAVTVQGSVDGTSDGADWDVAATGLRYEDADEVTSTETTAFDLQAAASSYSDATGEFTIEGEGAGDDLDLETSSEDPDSKTIALDEDDNTEDDIFAFELSAEDSDNDVDLNEVIVGVQVAGAVSVDDLVNDFRLEIDGESFDAESYTGTGSTTEITFDIDGDFTITADEVATAVLIADFENMDVTAREGATIVASTTADDIDAEGKDDIAVTGSDVEGETHSLRTEGLDVTYVSDDTTKTFTADETGEKDKVKYEVTFKVMAVGDNMYLDRTVTRDDTTAGGSAGDGFMWATTSDSTTGTTTVSGVVSAEDTDSDDTATKFYIAEGEEREFTIAITLESGTDGVAAVKLTALNWTTDSADATPDNFHTTSLDDFKTDLEDLFSE